LLDIIDVGFLAKNKDVVKEKTKMNNVLKKALCGCMALCLVATVMVGTAFNSKASASTVTTTTFAKNEARLANMSDEEFLNTFDNAKYDKEFSRNYSSKVTKGDDNLSLVMELLTNLTEEEINNTITGMYNKLPKIVQKFVTEEKLREVMVEFIEYMKTSEAGQAKVDAAIKYLAEKTKISETILKVVVEFALNYVQEVIAEGGSSVEPSATATVEPTQEVTVKPTVEATEKVTVEPTAEPTAEVTIEPTTEA
jgi:hypothetical protein